MIVEIFFFGLITFYSHSEDGKMTALLLDVPENHTTKGKKKLYIAGNGEIVAEHTPCLQLYNFTDEPETKDKKNNEHRELCEETDNRKLQRKRVEFRWHEDRRNESALAASTPRKGTLNIVKKIGHGNKPTNSCDAKAFDWTINWWKLHQTPEFDQRNLKTESPPDLIAAHIALTDGDIETCTLTRDGDEEDSPVSLFGFRPFSPPRDWKKGFQALAETVKLTMTNVDANRLGIAISDLNDSNIKADEVFLDPESGKCEKICTDSGCQYVCQLFIWNMPPKPPEGTPRSYTASHFEIQYELFEQPPKRRPVADRFKKGTTVWENNHCAVSVAFLRAVNNRPVCPMVQYP